MEQGWQQGGASKMAACFSFAQQVGGISGCASPAALHVQPCMCTCSTRQARCRISALASGLPSRVTEPEAVQEPGAWPASTSKRRDLPAPEAPTRAVMVPPRHAPPTSRSSHLLCLPRVRRPMPRKRSSLGCSPTHGPPEPAGTASLQCSLNWGPCGPGPVLASGAVTGGGLGALAGGQVDLVGATCCCSCCPLASIVRCRLATSRQLERLGLWQERLVGRAKAGRAKAGPGKASQRLANWGLSACVGWRVV